MFIYISDRKFEWQLRTSVIKIIIGNNNWLKVSNRVTLSDLSYQNV